MSMEFSYLIKKRYINNLKEKRINNNLRENNLNDENLFKKRKDIN